MKSVLIFIIFVWPSLFQICVAQAVSKPQVQMKKINLYGQMGFIECDDVSKLSTQMSPSATFGINKVLFPKFGGPYSFFFRSGVEYSYVSYYMNLHYDGQRIGIAPQTIVVSNISNHQINIPLSTSLGIVSKNWQYVGCIGIYGSYLFSFKENYIENDVEKKININNDINKFNAGIEISLGMDRLYTEKVIIEPFSGLSIGVRRSFMGLSSTDNLYKPVEIFTRVNLF